MFPGCFLNISGGSKEKSEVGEVPRGVHINAEKEEGGECVWKLGMR